MLLLAERLLIIAGGTFEMGGLGLDKGCLAVLGREGRIRFVGLIEAGREVGVGLRLNRGVFLAGRERQGRHAHQHGRNCARAKAPTGGRCIGHRDSFN